MRRLATGVCLVAALAASGADGSGDERRHRIRHHHRGNRWAHHSTHRHRVDATTQHSIDFEHPELGLLASAKKASLKPLIAARAKSTSEESAADLDFGIMRAQQQPRPDEDHQETELLRQRLASMEKETRVESGDRGPDMQMVLHDAMTRAEQIERPAKAADTAAKAAAKTLDMAMQNAIHGAVAVEMEKGKQRHAEAKAARAPQEQHAEAKESEVAEAMVAPDEEAEIDEEIRKVEEAAGGAMPGKAHAEKVETETTSKVQRVINAAPAVVPAEPSPRASERQQKAAESKHVKDQEISSMPRLHEEQDPMLNDARSLATKEDPQAGNADEDDALEAEEQAEVADEEAANGGTANGGTDAAQTADGSSGGTERPEERGSDGGGSGEGNEVAGSKRDGGGSGGDEAAGGSGSEEGNASDKGDQEEEVKEKAREQGHKHEVEEMEDKIEKDTRSEALAEMLGEIKMDLYHLDEKVDDVSEKLDSGVRLAAEREGEHILYPVSTTMRCIIMMTVQYFIVYTVAAAVKMAQDVLGQSEGTLCIALRKACDTVFYAPMLCVLFVGARMRALQITNGKGDPQLWAQNAMLLASFSLLAQTCLVLAIPLFTGHDAEVDTERGVKQPPIKDPAMAGLLTLLRFGAMSGLYVGTIFVCIAILLMDARSLGAKPVDLWDDPTTAATEYAPPVSPAVVCTMALTWLFFAVYVISAMLGAVAELGGGAYNPQSSRNLRVGLDGWMKTFVLCRKSVNLAPMLCILFIGARLRALQMDPKFGNPQRWAQFCFYICTAVVFMDVAFIIFTKIFGLEPTLQPGTNDMVFQVRSPMLKLTLTAVRYLFLFVLYSAAIAVIVSVFTLKAKVEEQTPAVSPAMACTIFLSAQFFVVYACLFVAQSLTALQDRPVYRRLLVVLLNAEITVRFAPMLSVLFLATRMRALELSRQRGSPQCWSQDAMYVTTLALFLQLLLVLLVGAFVKDVTMDDSGNPVAKVDSVLIASVMSAIKCVMFLALYGGVIVVVASVLVIRPETAVCEKRGGLLPETMGWPE